ncbi:MAG: Do family serine endopeptidase, partial [Alphaproteobacteria bacterium]
CTRQHRGRRRRAGARAAAPLRAVALAPAAAPARGAGESFAPLVREVSPAVVNIAASRDAQPADIAQRRRPAPMPGSPLEEFLRRFGDPGARPDATPRRATALGSGFVVDPAGYIVTNNHVAGDATDIAVTFPDGRQLKARLVGRDEKTDLALLKVESDRPLQSVRWGDSDAVQVGDWVLAVGNPFGLGGTVTAGIVSARGRDIQAGPYDDFLQLDAPINQGNSGGPSFDMQGAVIGVNTAIYSPNGGSVGIGFAIPSAVARPVVEELRARGRVERGWIGVAVQPLTPEIALGLGLQATQEGALVAQVEPGSPAAIGGLRQGDVVVAVDGKSVNRLRELPRAIAAVKPGEVARLEVLRRGAATQVSLRVGTTPQAERAAVDEPAGLAFAPLTAELRARLDLPAEARGAAVAQVRDGSLAQRAGIAPGDVVVEVGGEKVESPGDAVRAISEARARHAASVVLLVDRHGAERYVALRLPHAPG